MSTSSNKRQLLFLNSCQLYIMAETAIKFPNKWTTGQKHFTFGRFSYENVGTETFRYVTLMFKISVAPSFFMRSNAQWNTLCVSFANSHEATAHKFETSIFDADASVAPSFFMRSNAQWNTLCVSSANSHEATAHKFETSIFDADVHFAI